MVAAVTRRFFLLAATLVLGLYSGVTVGQEFVQPLEPALLTNLFQLRTCANQQPSVVHPFRIVADVYDADPASGVLVLHDASGTEFIHLDFHDQNIEPGTTICLQGNGCSWKPKRFGLALVPGLVVDNDGVHGRTVESGAVFLHAGPNPVTLQWFNRSGDLSLTVEYEGPGIPRQRIPGSVLSRAKFNPTTGQTNFSSGLDYRCYEGSWQLLPDFRKYRAAKSGVATNFEVGVRTRNESVGLEFNGFISIPRDGLYTFHLMSDDGSLLFLGESSVTVQLLSKNPVSAEARVFPGGLKETNRHWLTLEGTITSAGLWGSGGELQLRVGKDDIRVEVFENGGSVPGIRSNARIRVTGIYEDVVNNEGSRIPGILLVSSWKAVQPLPFSDPSSPAATGAGPTTNGPGGDKVSSTSPPTTISTAAEVKALSAEMANQQLPVSIRGVVTAFRSVYAGAVIQDSTRGVFVDVHDLREFQPLQRGEFYQIDGVTGPGYYAPMIVARRITHLGAGRMPEPLRPTWDQLMNGSVDTEYAEIEGVVTAAQDHRLTVLTEGGKIVLDLEDFLPEALVGYENARVRIRGCIFANFNLITRKLEVGSLLVSGGTVNILQSAPLNPFNAPHKSIGELLFYDPKAASFRLLKVRGQVIFARADRCFLTDGTNGIHVSMRNSNAYAVGDVVEAVGFLDLGGPSVGLKEAMIRKIGHAPLPKPTKLAPDDLLQTGHAGTLVQLEAALVNDWLDGSEHVLELQSGFLAFAARVDTHGRAIPLPPFGSRLELTGVYAPRGAGVGNVNGFDLLLSSPAGIRVMATPPWWTLKRVLVLVGILAALLCALLIWNKELQRKVQERGRQLEREIRNRQQAELQRAAEAERSRIARDLHDELGTGLTEVSLLANAGFSEIAAVEKNSDRFRSIAEKARSLVLGLDVIVWAIDPKRNSLQSFADYFGRYATELFSASGIVCRFQIPIECEPVALMEAPRHSLFLAVKEALNNVIRHASATEVTLQMRQIDNFLEIVISDNGRGFDPATVRRGNGLTNLQERLKALNGECHITSQLGKGTTVKFVIPLLNALS